MVKSVGKYDLYRTLGEGAYGKVKYAVNRETNEAVAIKILDKDKIQQQHMGAQIKKEIAIMKMIHHKHVICVRDVFATATKIFIVVELVEGGELFEHLVDKKMLSENEARFFFHQLVDGLTYCHAAGVCHRDLKPENLLLDAGGNIKISDFGLSTLYVGDADAEGSARSDLLHTTCGTPNYVAPEVLEQRGYDGKKADVWSCGVILFVLLAGYLPFEEETMPALFAKIKQADFAYPVWFSPQARALLGSILVPNPAARCSLAEVYSHPWMHSGPRDAPKSIKQKLGQEVPLGQGAAGQAVAVAGGKPEGLASAGAALPVPPPAAAAAASAAAAPSPVPAAAGVAPPAAPAVASAALAPAAAIAPSAAPAPAANGCACVIA